MATTKKAAPKKATVRKPKAAATKKPVASKAVKKAAPRRKATTKSARITEAEMRSFRVYPESQPFTNARFTRQTLYWLILAAFIVFIQLWILQLQLEVVTLIDAQYDQLLK